MNQEIYNLLSCLSLELESEIESRYRLRDGSIHPAMQRKYDQDMFHVRKTEELLKQYPEYDPASEEFR